MIICENEIPRQLVWGLANCSEAAPGLWDIAVKI